MRQQKKEGQQKQKGTGTPVTPESGTSVKGSTNSQGSATSPTAGGSTSIRIKTDTDNKRRTKEL
jgi:hypothetical protein